MRLPQLLRPVLACLALAFLICTLSAPAFAQASGSVGGAGAPASRGYDPQAASTTSTASVCIIDVVRSEREPEAGARASTPESRSGLPQRAMTCRGTCPGADRTSRTT